MRRIAGGARVAALTLALLAAHGTAARAEATTRDFQARLAPHGQWIASARHGQVWRPKVARSGWHPYVDGHWELTDVGQTWVSDYAWGGVAYHYGTWAMEPGRGWVWIPGDTWAPSWVVFRTGSDVIGWAPVAPGTMVGSGTVLPSEAEAGFVFVPSRQFFAPRIRASALPASRVTTVIKKTRVVRSGLRIEDRVVVNRALSVDELRRATGRPVRVARLESLRGNGAGDQARHPPRRGPRPQGGRGVRLEEGRVSGAGGSARRRTHAPGRRRAHGVRRDRAGSHLEGGASRRLRGPRRP